MIRVESRWQSCLCTSRPIAAWFCRRTVASAAVVVLIRLYLRLLVGCIQRSASSGVPAAAVSPTSVSTVVAFSALASRSGVQLLPSLLLPADPGRCCPVCPCML